MRELATGYLWDAARHARLVADGENDWFCYAADLLERIGAPAVALERSEFASPAALARFGTLLLPDLSVGDLRPDESAALHAWVREGGLLVGLATEGADDLFGVTGDGRLEQPGDPWSLAATLRFTDDHLARPLHHPDRPEPALLAVSPVRLLRLDGAIELAALGDLGGQSLDRPAITLRRLGRGHACLFAFDLAQTLWALQQGRPVDRDYSGDGYLRSNDGIIIGEMEPEVPYADLLVLLLRNLVALTGRPFLHQLPALDGGVPDALLYWGGDDEGCPGGDNLYAARFMNQRGLPYHTNIMPRDGAFATTAAEAAELRELGCETSLHLNFVDGYEHPLRFTDDDVRGQVELYRQTFGQTPVCTVFHWVLWHGWTEPAAWLRAEGVEADNSRFGRTGPGLNPVNTLNYSFGTALPFFFRLGPDGDNRRLDFVSQPITAYEVGYLRPEGTDFAPLHRAIGDAAWWHLTMDMFYHPVCVVGYPQCRDAIDEALACLQRRGLRAVHLGNDALNRWWRARTAGRLDNVRRGDDRLTFAAECAWPGGFVALVPIGAGDPAVEVDGRTAEGDVRAEFGRRWLRLALEPGHHRVTVGGEPIAGG